MNRVASTRFKFPPMTTWNHQLPFTATSLRNIIGPKLAQAAASSDSATSSNVIPSGIKRHAAVLIPLCNVLNPLTHVYEPSILLTVRGSGLRTHSGEVSFPGGGVDSTDASYQFAAIRETQEELGVHPSRIEIIGELHPKETAKRADTLVHAFVGFVHRDSAWSNSTPNELADQLAIPPIDFEATRRYISSPVTTDLPREVDHVFHLPLSTLFHEKHRRREGAFERSSGTRRYWAIGVDDLVFGANSSKFGSSGPSEALRMNESRVVPDSEVGIGGGDGSGLEIWGLTGWYLNQFLGTVFPEQWDVGSGNDAKL